MGNSLWEGVTKSQSLNDEGPPDRIWEWWAAGGKGFGIWVGNGGGAGEAGGGHILQGLQSPLCRGLQAESVTCWVLGPRSCVGWGSDLSFCSESLRVTHESCELKAPGVGDLDLQDPDKGLTSF